MAWQKFLVKVITLGIGLIILIAAPQVGIGFLIGKFGEPLWGWLNEPELVVTKSETKSQS